MINWKVTEKGFDPEKIASNGNKFLIGNGYMGVRGTLQEFDKSKLVAINLAGIYDQVGETWREPLNAPNGFFGYLTVDGEELRLPDKEPEEHSIELDYRHGIFKRRTKWSTARGNIIIQSERVVSMKNVHLGAMKCTITADFHADVKYRLGIDADVWDINGPHYDEIVKDAGEILSVDGITHEKNYHVSMALGEVTDFPCEIIEKEKETRVRKSIYFITDRNQTCTIERFFGVYTSRDCDNPMDLAKQEVVNANRQVMTA